MQAKKSRTFLRGAKKVPRWRCVTFSNGSSDNFGWSLVYGPEGSVKYNGPLKSVKHKITGFF